MEQREWGARAVERGCVDGRVFFFGEGRGCVRWKGSDVGRAKGCEVGRCGGGGRWGGFM